MEIKSTELDGVKTLHPKVFKDDRGYFLESWNQRILDQAGLDVRFVQDNESLSTRGALRGIHLQKAHPQGKLVRAIKGEVFDLAVDLRLDSPNFGKWVGRILSEANKTFMWIPPGFGHAYYTMSETAIFFYKCTDYYYPDDQFSLVWNDPAVGIDWPLVPGSDVILSEKDRTAPTLEELKLVL